MFGQGKFQEIFGELPRAVLDNFNYHCREKTYVKGQAILRQGNPAPTVHFIRTGYVKLYKSGLDGKQQIVGLAGPGDILGYRSLFDGAPYHVTVMALDLVRVASIKREQVTALLERHARFGMAFLEKLIRDLNAAEDLATDIAQRPVRERLAAFLLALADRFGFPSTDGVAVGIPLSLTEIGEAVGVTRETATRLMSGFRKEGLIASGRRLVLLDPNRLSDFVSSASL